MMKVNNWFHYTAIDCKMGTHAIQLHDPWVWCVCNGGGCERAAPGGGWGNRGPAYISTQHSTAQALRAYEVNYWKQPAKLSVLHSHSIKDIDLKMLSSSERLSERKCNGLVMWWGVSTKLYVQPVAAETGPLNKKRHAIYRRAIYSNSEVKPSTHKLSLMPWWQAKLLPRDTADIIFTEWTGKYFDILIDCSSDVLRKNVKMSLSPASRVWIFVDFLVLSDIKLNLFDRWSRHFFGSLD